MKKGLREAGIEKGAARIAAGLEKVQRGFARVMDRWFAGMPRQRLKGWLVLFIIAGLAASLLPVLRAFRSFRPGTEAPPVQTFRLPRTGGSDSLTLLETIYKSYQHE